MDRIPNTHNPVEVRRAIGRLREDTDNQADDITAIEGDITTIEGNITSMDGRVTALEDIAPSYFGEAVEIIAAGMPVYGVSGSSKVGKALANAVAKSRVAGLATASAGVGISAEYLAAGRLELADWTSVSGSAALTPSAVYYLAEAGGITTTAPTAAGSYVVEIGRAVSATILDISIQRPILL